MEAADPARPLDGEVDILRLTVRQENRLRDKLVGAKDHRCQGEEEQHRNPGLVPQSSNVWSSFFLVDLSSCLLLPALCGRWSHPASLPLPALLAYLRYLVPDHRNSVTGWATVGPRTTCGSY